MDDAWLATDCGGLQTVKQIGWVKFNEKTHTFWMV
jgi:hypothetical protein